MDNNIMQMLQSEQVHGVPSIYDDDKIENDVCDIILDDNDNECFGFVCVHIARLLKERHSSKNRFDMNAFKVFSLLDEKEAELTFENSPTKKWDKYTPKMLKKPKHSALTSETKNKSRDVWIDVARMKLKKYELEIKVIEEESKLRKTKLELEIEELRQKVGKYNNTASVMENVYSTES